jgi:hypothetical protein
MGRHIHICQSVSGALRNWTKAEWNRVAKENDMGKGYGGNFPGEYAKWEFKNMLADGIKVIPIGEKCEGFSYQTGCPGHPIAETFDEQKGTR